MYKLTEVPNKLTKFQEAPLVGTNAEIAIGHGFNGVHGDRGSALEAVGGKFKLAAQYGQRVHRTLYWVEKECLYPILICAPLIHSGNALVDHQAIHAHAQPAMSKLSVVYMLHYATGPARLLHATAP